MLLNNNASLKLRQHLDHKILDEDLDEELLENYNAFGSAFALLMQYSSFCSTPVLFFDELSHQQIHVFFV